MTNVAGLTRRPFGLTDTVATESARLSDGKHPETEALWFGTAKLRGTRTRIERRTKPVEHRAGWEATLSAHKSVSLTALPETIANQRANVADVMRGQNFIKPIMTVVAIGDEITGRVQPC